MQERWTPVLLVVAFTAENGDRVHFRDHSGSNPPLFHVGDHVTVLYLASDLRSAMIDRGAANWLPTFMVLLVGCLLSVVSVRALRNRTRE